MKPFDACSWNGLTRRELLWCDARLHGTHEPFICSYCADLAHEIFCDNPNAASSSDLCCSFCGVPGRLCAGPAHYICEQCARRFVAAEEPAWGTIRNGLHDVRDAACVVELAKSFWDALCANDVPVSHCATSIDDLAQVLSRDSVVELGWRAPSTVTWTTTGLLSCARPTKEELEQSIRRFSAMGVLLRTGPHHS
jgi:hypothetical protein